MTKEEIRRLIRIGEIIKTILSWHTATHRQQVLFLVVMDFENYALIHAVRLCTHQSLTSHHKNSKKTKILFNH